MTSAEARFMGWVIRIAGGLVLVLGLAYLLRAEGKSIVAYSYKVEQYREPDKTIRYRCVVRTDFDDGKFTEKLYAVETAEPADGKSAIKKARRRAISQCENWMESQEK